MGVFDFVKSGTAEMRIERTSADVVFLHPELTLPLWGQLLVEDDDAAVFVNEGRALGIVGPGRHAVHPSKLSFLEGFVDGAGRIAVRLALVRLTPIPPTRFGGTLDPFADPGALDSVVPVLAGHLSVEVIDPIAFVEEHLAGGAERPILARRGIVATIDGVRLAVHGRRVPVFAGQKFRRRPEAPSAPTVSSGESMACRECGELGEAGTFCAACGALVTERDQCVGCRAELREGAQFCEACGVRVRKTAAPSARPTTARQSE